MIDFGFDKYTFQARLRPALLSIFPVIVTVYVWVPVLYQTAAGLLGAAVVSGVTVAFGHFARTQGRSIEGRLLKEWGNLPTTLWLRHRDHHLEAETKQRYHRFLEENIDGWIAPAIEDEVAFEEKADNQYKSAVRWLIQNTRNKKEFFLIYAENISYGFRRNSLGLKPLSIALSLICLGFSIYKLHDIPLRDIFSLFLVQSMAGVVSLVCLAWWTCGVTTLWVRDAADSYAKALLEVCDGPAMNQRRARQKATRP